jgi:hypothetical protein
VVVRAVTYGTNHVLIDGPLWARLAGRLLPRATAYKYGLLRNELHSRVPTCVVWTRWRVPSNRPAARFVSVLDPQLVESEPSAAQLVQHVPNSRDVIEAWLLENYPRRGRNLRLRFYDRDAAYRRVFAGEVTVQNPFPGGSGWNAPPPPVRVLEGSSEFALLSLRCRGGPPVENASTAGLLAPLELPSPFLAPWTDTDFAVLENGQPGSAWTVRSIAAAGVTGNRLASAYPAVELVDDRIRAHFPGALWSEEPDWKVTAEFSRARDYAPEELITIKSLNAVRSRFPVTTNLSPQMETNGARLQSVTLVAGLSQIRPYRGGDYFPNSEVTLLFTVRDDRTRVNLARVTDERGRAVRFGHSSDASAGKYTAALELPADATTLELTFAVHRSRFIEFLARPAWNFSNPPSAFSPPGPEGIKGAR